MFHYFTYSKSVEYVPFDLRNNPAAIPPPYKHLIKPYKLLTENHSGVHILNSCNGFLLCGSAGSQGKFHLYNPTTKQLTTFPKPKRWRRSPGVPFRGLALAFDPVKSRHYKVVCVRALRPSGVYTTVIYSSETSTWKDSSEVSRMIWIPDLRKGYTRTVESIGSVGLGRRPLCSSISRKKSLD